MNVILNVKEPPVIVICLPGRVFSGEFLDCYTKLLGYFYENNIRFIVSRQYSPVIYYVRNLCLGGDNLRGTNQKPFNGRINYTHLLWIDSDIIFTRKDIISLLNYDLDVISGIYKMKGGEYYATVKDWDEEYFKRHGSFPFLTDDDVKDKGLMKVDYTGFGFILIKRRVFEALEYPWFRPLWHEIGTCKDFSSEDASVCKLINKVGFDIHIDAGIKVGHLKEVVI